MPRTPLLSTCEFTNAALAALEPDVDFACLPGHPRSAGTFVWADFSPLAAPAVERELHEDVLRGLMEAAPGTVL